jgi:hypothetical protein
MLVAIRAAADMARRQHAAVQETLEHETRAAQTLWPELPHRRLVLHDIIRSIAPPTTPWSKSAPAWRHDGQLLRLRTCTWWNWTATWSRA